MRRIYVLMALSALCSAGLVHADDKFGDLTYLLPPSANAATVIDVQAIYDSPLAQKERWATNRPLPFPPTLYTVALATRIDPGSLSGGHWEVGVGRPKGRLTMDHSPPARKVRSRRSPAPGRALAAECLFRRV